MNEKYWKNVWEKKGKLAITDLRELDGHEDTVIDSEKVTKKIMEISEGFYTKERFNVLIT